MSEVHVHDHRVAASSADGAVLSLTELATERFRRVMEAREARRRLRRESRRLERRLLRHVLLHELRESGPPGRHDRRTTRPQAVRRPGERAVPRRRDHRLRRGPPSGGVQVHQPQGEPEPAGAGNRSESEAAKRARAATEWRRARSPSTFRATASATRPESRRSSPDSSSALRECAVHVRTTAPAWLFPPSEGRLRVHSVATDVGMVQPHGLSIDFATTIARLDELEATLGRSARRRGCVARRDRRRPRARRPSAARLGGCGAGRRAGRGARQLLVGLDLRLLH